MQKQSRGEPRARAPPPLPGARPRGPAHHCRLARRSTSACSLRRSCCAAWPCAAVAAAAVGAPPGSLHPRLQWLAAWVGLQLRSQPPQAHVPTSAATASATPLPSARPPATRHQAPTHLRKLLHHASHKGAHHEQHHRAPGAGPRRRQRRPQRPPAAHRGPELLVEPARVGGLVGVGWGELSVWVGWGGVSRVCGWVGGEGG